MKMREGGKLTFDIKVARKNVTISLIAIDMLFLIYFTGYK